MKNFRMGNDATVPGFKQSIFTLCRIIFSSCIFADIGWYLVSLETRIAYFRDLGLSTLFLSIIIAAYLLLGMRLMLNYGMESTCIALIITYALVGFIVHLPVGSGGIGEYPSHIHGEINFLQFLAYAGLVGGVLVMLGSSDLLRRGELMEGSSSYAIVLGRAFVCLHFIIGTLYFKFYQYNLRSKQIAMMGGSQFLHIACIGTIHLVAAFYAWLGSTQVMRKNGSLALAAVTIIMAVVENGSMATSVGVYHMKLEARYHQFVTQVGIATACMLLYSTAELKTKPYKEAQE